jgi:type VI secretion system VgrG family protein
MPAYLEEKKFHFVSAAPGLDQTTFSVVNFKGDEGLSRLYEFEITLASNNPEIDLETMLNHPATLYLKGEHALPVHGVLSSFEQLQAVDNMVIYRAVLSPKLWELTLYKVSEIYLDLTVPEVIEKVLKEAGFIRADYELRFQRRYRQWSHVCQYQETHFNFLSRWMEREGICYFFEQGPERAKLIITDTHIAFADNRDGAAVHYAPPSGLGANVQGEVITELVCEQHPVPAKVTVQDFNHRLSPPVIEATVPVSPTGKGELMIYGEHVKNNEEAETYAKLRAEELLCRRRVFHGESTIPSLRVGWFVRLDRHYRNNFNQKYLLTGTHHEGSQAAYLIASTSRTPSAEEQKPYYRNSFTAIPGDIVFRPGRETPKPRFYGTINAKVEGEGSGKYAEIDEYGRYKVKFPFDRSDRAGQKASRWIRMAQPYAGPNEGMHFPLRKGAEVLLTFMDGDPDRPLISAAVPSTENPSVVTDANLTRNTLLSAGGNLMEFQDQDGKQRVFLSTPSSNSYLHLGAPNSPTMETELRTDDSLLVHGGKNTFHEAGNLHTEDKWNSLFTVTGTRGQTGYSCRPKSDTVGTMTIAVENDQKTFIGDTADLEIGNSTETAGGFDAPKSRTTPVDRYGLSKDASGNLVLTPELTTLKNTFASHGCNFDFLKTATADQAGTAYLDTIVQNETIHGTQNITIEGDVVLNVTGTSYGGATGHAVNTSSGCDIEVTTGNTYSYHGAHAYEYHQGNSYEYHKGDSFETIVGNETTEHQGNSTEKFQGSRFEMSTSTSFSVAVGANAELKLAEDFELSAGLKQEVALAMTLEVLVGIAMEISLAVKFEIGLGLELKSKRFHLAEKEFELKAHMAKIGTIKTTEIKLPTIFAIV